jgi:hypothetical protein
MSAPEKRPAFEPAERLLRPPHYDPAMKRPLTTVAGALLVFLSGFVNVLTIIELLLSPDPFAGEPIDLDGVTREQAVGVGIAFAVGVLVVLILVDVVLGILILRGSNWPRVLVMIIAVFSICVAFGTWWAGEQEITLKTSFLSTALDTLVLLALSSRSAAAYARRNERR